MPTESEERAKRRVLSFLHTEVAKYLVPDLERLLNCVRPEGREGLRACTVATAQFAFSILDYFGYLIRDDDTMPDKRATAKNITWLLKNRDFFDQAYEELAVENAIAIFRHGMIHQIFPKACGVGKCGSSRPLLFHQDNMLHLNIDVLVRDLIAFLKKLEDKIEKDASCVLATQMNQRLDALNQEDHEALEKLKESLPRFFQGTVR